MAGAQLTEVILAGAVRPSVVVRDDPLNDAVMVPFWSELIVPAVAVNVALPLPEGTDAEAGTVNNALLLESATLPPAVPETVTLQVLDPPEPNDEGAQVKPVTVGTTTDDTAPPVPAKASACPSAEAAMVSAIPSVTVLDADGDSVTLMAATTPF